MPTFTVTPTPELLAHRLWPGSTPANLHKLGLLTYITLNSFCVERAKVREKCDDWTADEESFFQLCNELNCPWG